MCRMRQHLFLSTLVLDHHEIAVPLFCGDPACLSMKPPERHAFVKRRVNSNVDGIPYVKLLEYKVYIRSTLLAHVLLILFPGLVSFTLMLMLNHKSFTKENVCLVRPIRVFKPIFRVSFGNNYLYM